MYLEELVKMYEVTIDPERCKKDGLCAMICPDAIIQQDEKVTIPKISMVHRCYLLFMLAERLGSGM